MRTVGLLALPDTRSFDVAVTAEVWSVDMPLANIAASGGPFELRICAPRKASVALRPVGALVPTHGLSGLADCDLVVLPGRYEPLAPVPQSVIRALRAYDGVIATLCSGAFTAAAAGLLDGRPATTHWRLLPQLAVAAPRAEIRGDVLFTDDGTVLTSAGVVGGVDLCLHLVRRALGASVATALARRLVMPPAREGDQRQYIDAPVPPRPAQAGIGSTVDWASARLESPLGVGDLAAHAGMSERNFHRAFTSAMGTTPGKWLLAQRIRHAQRLLETTDLSVDRVADRCGLGTAANLRRRMHSALGVTPGAYRRTFHTP
ncbi:helix-turn-helix domain-containing protein [Allokutzneria sp. A3M-2-11 16]|uniref:GlxA family transcriptional regulator n=1 Tax=Allokutzneria sp. A3M-2-11 16 TaxID=2962043 RepID=UPI0020B7F507|nr:helix-turn-helix domain-containing protein [Allokutzneria sp. A3M-2-11 16]MCP3798240.1 helix-turn-helix domain-containing protein [Allokutzneria sp. A3M-2-11 16]